jgi:glycosyltransferase involved in cell wall biosynthesis
MDELNQVINDSSIVYGTGRGLREAMLCGKVCISLDACGYDGIVTKDTIEGIVHVNFSGRSQNRKPTVKDTMLNDLNYLFNNIDKQIEISNWSYEYALNNFTLNNFINSHEEIYKNLVMKNV